MADASFVHLHVHSEHSALDSTARVTDLVTAAADDGQPAVAITDHGTLAGVFTAMTAARGAGIKLIAGEEVYLAIGDRHERNTMEVPRDGVATDADTTGGGLTKTKRYHHLTVLARNQTGWANLVAMHNEAQNSRWGKHPRIDYDLLAEHAEGLIVLTGCLGGPVLGPLAHGDEAGARAGLEALIDAVGAKNVYVEVMEHGIGIESAALPRLVELAEEYGLDVVATNDAHHVEPDGDHAHEAWLALQTKKTLEDPASSRFTFTGSGYHLRTAEEMYSLRDEPWWAQACRNTVALADRVDADILPEHYLRLPKFPTPEGFDSSKDYFVHLVKEGAKARYGDPYPQQVRERLNAEMKVIRSFGVIDYFLIVHELITWARSHGIRVGPGRGSAAGSVASYCLGIVQVDPLRFDLLFERFLDPTRVGMPDIDIDFEKGRRDEVLAHLVDMYGEDYVARIGTFQVSKTKASIKSATRVLGLPASLGDRLSKAVPMDGAEPYTFARMDTTRSEDAAGFWEEVEADERAPRVIDLARQFEQVTTGASIHACGTVVSDAPLGDLIPMRKDTGAGSHEDDPLVTEWDASGVDDGIGLLKLDVLGLRNLDVVSAAVANIAELTGETIDPDNLPDGDDLDDERVLATWRLLAQGHTAGVFQLESGGMTELTRDVAPTSLEHLSALVALYRPGPMAADMHIHYAARKNGREKVDYSIFTSDPAEQEQIARVLGSTLGLCIAEGERVYLADGGTREIQQIKPGDWVQATSRDKKTVPARVSRVFDNGVKPVVSARFSGGQVVKMTRDHRVMTPDGWTSIEDVPIGGLVAAPKEAIGSGSNHAELSVNHARLMGWLLANGELTFGEHVRFSSMDGGLIEAFKVALSEAFPSARPSHHIRPDTGMNIVAVGNGMGNGGPAGDVLRWLRRLNLKSEPGAERGGAGSREKFIPDEWLASPTQSVAALLAALWDCDGHISSRGGIRYKSSSQRLADGIAYLLLRLGITSTVSRSSYDTQTKGPGIAHEVVVSDAAVFLSAVGPLLTCRSKAQAAEEFVVSPRYGGPVPARFTRAAALRSGPSMRAFAERHGIPRSSLAASRTVVSEHTAQSVARATGDRELQEVLAVRWVRLVSISDAGESRVWDLEVEGVHNFIASGVVVHNCIYQEQMMLLGDVVAGFGPAERNRLRKAVSKKIAAEVEAVGELFLAGAVSDTATDGSPKLAFSARTAQRVWDSIKGGAAYAFNKSHSAAYGYLAYVTAFLKANWPSAYGAALLAQTDDPDKRATALAALDQEGVRVLPPQVNSSQYASAAVDASTVVLGLGEVRDVGKAAAAIVAEREARGRFSSMADVLERVELPGGDGKPSKLTTKAAQGLIECGAADEFGPRLGQVRSLWSMRAHSGVPVPDEEWGLVERAVRQHQRLGLVIGRHPMSALSRQVKEWDPPVLDQDGEPLGLRPRPIHRALSSGRSTVLTVGLVTQWKVKPDNRGGRRAFLMLEGSKGSIEAMVWDSTLKWLDKSGHRVGVGSVVGVQARVRTREFEQVDDEGQPYTVELHSLTVTKMWPIRYRDVDARAAVVPPARVVLREHMFTPGQVLERPVTEPVAAGQAPVPVVSVEGFPRRSGRLAVEPGTPGQQRAGGPRVLFVDAMEMLSSQALPGERFPPPPNDFYEPGLDFFRCYRRRDGEGNVTLLVVSAPDREDWTQAQADEALDASSDPDAHWVDVGSWERWQPDPAAPGAGELEASERSIER